MCSRIALLLVAFFVLSDCSIKAQAPKPQAPSKDVKEQPASTGPVEPDPKAEAEAAEISKLLEKVLNYQVSENFTWCAAFDEGKLRTIVDAAEKAYSLMAEHVGIKDWRELWNEQRALVVIVPAKRDYEKFNKWYANRYPVWDKKAFCDIHDKSNYYYESYARRILACHIKPNDENYIRNVVVHLFGHQFINRYLFNQKSSPSWMEESLGIYLEAQVMGKLVGKCFREQYAKQTTEADSRTGFTAAKWKSRVKQTFSTHTAKSMTALWKIDFSQMSLDDAAKGYAVIAWMMSQPGKFAEYMSVLKKNWPDNCFSGWVDGMATAQAKALQEVFKMTPEEADVAVEKFVFGSSF